MAQGQAPGVVAAVAQGDETYITAAGVMAVGGPPMRPDTLFRISSTTKPITAAVILSLVDDGLLDLDGPVETLLPELAGRRVLRRPDGPLDRHGQSGTAGDRPRPAHLHVGFRHAGGDVHGPRPVADRVRGGRARAGLVRSAKARSPPRNLTPGWRGWVSCRCWPSPGSGGCTRRAPRCSACWPPARAAPRSRTSCASGCSPRWACATPRSTRKTRQRLATAYESHDGQLTVTDPPEGQWARPPRFPDGSGGLVSTAGDLLAFGRMLLRGGGSGAEDAAPWPR